MLCGGFVGLWGFPSPSQRAAELPGKPVCIAVPPAGIKCRGLLNSHCSGRSSSKWQMADSHKHTPPLSLGIFTACSNNWMLICKQKVPLLLP